MKLKITALIYFFIVSISGICQIPNELPNTESQFERLLKQIKENPIPRNNTQLERELTDIEELINECFYIQNDSAEILSERERLADIDNLRAFLEKEIPKAKDQISKLISGKPVPTNTLKLLVDLNDMINESQWSGYVQNLSTHVGPITFKDESSGITAIELTNLQSAFSQEKVNQLFSDLNKEKDAILARIKMYEARKKFAEKIDHELKERKLRVGEILDNNQFSNTSSKDNFLRSQLVWFIIILSVFGIGAMAVVRLFSPAMQEEWVASGQVIQFVTVMILLIIILCLALLGVVGEETIGTLLGGIGGYVLSQGIGRAATRATQQAILTQPHSTNTAQQANTTQDGGGKPTGSA